MQLQKTRARITDDVAAGVTRRNEVSENITELEAELASLQGTVATASAARDELDGQIVELKAVLARQEERMDANRIAVASVETELESKSAKRDGLLAEIDRLSSDQTSLEDAILDLTGQRRDLKLEIVRLADLVEAKLEQLAQVLSPDIVSIRNEASAAPGKQTDVQPIASQP